jgi:hypothetical protein
LATQGFSGLLKPKKVTAICHIRLLNVGHPRPLQPAKATNKPLGTPNIFKDLVSMSKLEDYSGK